MRRRRALLAGTFVLVVLSAVLGWVAGQFIRSPAEVAAAAAPPEPSLITVPVERRTLTSDVVVRGTVRLGDPRVVTLAGTPGGPEAAAAVVTRPPEQGAELREGTLALEVSGRPVLVLVGPIPTYRDLAPGDVGDDVAQLEQALDRLGHRPGTVDRVYDTGTEDAVTSWYRSVGYDPVGPTREEADSLDAAEEALAAAEQQVREAERALDDMTGGSGRAEALAADAAVRAARDQLAVAQVTASAALETAARTTAEAEAALEAARTAARQDHGPEAAAAVYDAEVALAEARNAEQIAQAEHGALVGQARDGVAVAEAQRAALGGQGADVERETLQAAREARERAREDLDELEREVGVSLPAAEVVFLPELPLRIDAVAVSRGDDATGEIMTVTGTGLAIDSALSLSDRRLVEPGDRVRISESSLGIEVEGVVGSIAEQPGTNEVDAQSYYMEVVPDEAPPELQDASVRITIPVESTDGEVLAVPLAALSAAADGTSRVEVAEEGGGPDDTRFVTVTAGLSAEGLVEVSPVDGNLDEGDQVVVGR